LRRVLLDLLADSNRLRRESKRRGVAASELQDPLFAANIHHAITGLRDPQAIPLLAEAMGWFTAVRALADFGEQAVPSVLGVISAPDADHYAVEDGLRVLRLIVENKEKTPISAASRAAIVQVAGENLKGGPHFATLWYAIDLAAVLKDPELDRELKVLATDQKAVMGRGVDDPKLMAETMKRAADRLAGVPANPRP
jgi:hypothetical protein